VLRRSAVQLVEATNLLRFQTGTWQSPERSRRTRASSWPPETIEKLIVDESRDVDVARQSAARTRPCRR
jgi:hypothetical protein